MPRTLYLCMYLLAVTAGACGQLELTNYKLTTFDGVEHATEMGRLQVASNHAAASSAPMQIAFVRLRGLNPGQHAPIVFLSGGPGIPGIIMGRVPVYYRLFDRLRQISDVIVLDQRGIGLSTPTLDECPSGGPLPLDAFADLGKLTHAVSASIRNCAQYWSGRHVDLTVYNTDESADDLEDLRVALGARQLSLLGFSYGTELALAMIRRHPDSVERVVFQGTQPAENYPSLPSTYDLQLRTIARLAEAPDLAVVLETCLRKLADPVRMEIDSETAKEKVALLVGPPALQFLAIDSLNSGASILPALLKTVSQGDYSVLGPLAERTYEDFSHGMGMMGRAVDCSAVTSPERVALSAADVSPFDHIRNFHLQPELCQAAVGSFHLGPEYTRPVFSTVPALFLSGTLDANTPPFLAEKVRWGLPNSTHIEVENGFHEMLPAQDVQDAVFDFFSGKGVSARRIVFAPPHFDSIEEARLAARKPRH
jgi:pimeloyl-ACP methyl ester carboxylesterase